jgi:hypothetical protein
MKPEAQKVIKQIHFLISRTNLKKCSKYSYYDVESTLHLLIGTDNLGNAKIGIGFKNEPPVTGPDADALGQLPAHYIQSCITSGKQFKEFISSFNVFVDEYVENSKTYVSESVHTTEYVPPLGEWKGKEWITSSMGNNE